MAEAIVGDHVKVNSPATSSNPALWQPSDTEIVEIQQADLIILNGANYAAWVDKVTLPETKLVNTSVVFQDRYIYLEDLDVHQHGPDGEHSHRGFAPQTWLSPELAELQAEQIAEAVIAKWPELSADFKSNLNELKSNLAQQIKRADELKGVVTGRVVVSAKPQFKYFCESLGLADFHLHLPDNPLDVDIERMKTKLVEIKEKASETGYNLLLLVDKTSLESLTPELKQLFANAKLKPLQLDTCDGPGEGTFINRLNANYLNMASAIGHPFKN